jgi:hypothetical protein
MAQSKCQLSAVVGCDCFVNSEVLVIVCAIVLARTPPPSTDVVYAASLIGDLLCDSISNLNLTVHKF